MSALTNKIKDIDQRTKDLSVGYIRQSTKSITWTAIPIRMINSICLMYYYVLMDKFVRWGKSIKLTSSNGETNNIATSTPSVGIHYGSSHGNIIIDPKIHPKVIATWTVKVNSSNCAIGIHSEYGTNSINFGSKYINYAWKGDGQTLEPNHDGGDWSRGLWSDYDQFGSGDVIKIELDIFKRRLIFYKNDEDTNFAIDDVDISKSYHLMVTLGRKQRFGAISPSAEIIDFKMENCKILCYYQKSYNYSRPEQFVKHSLGLEILEKGGTLKGTSNNDCIGVAYGDIIIKPNQNPEMVAKWKFKVNANYTFIGISSEYNDNCIANNGDGLDLTIPECNDDMIEMELNIPQKKLKFYWNDRLFHVAENDVDMSKQYHLMVLMTGKQKDCIQLIQFKKQNHKILSFYSE